MGRRRDNYKKLSFPFVCVILIFFSPLLDRLVSVLVTSYKISRVVYKSPDCVCWREREREKEQR